MPWSSFNYLENVINSFMPKQGQPIMTVLISLISTPIISYKSTVSIGLLLLLFGSFLYLGTYSTCTSPIGICHQYLLTLRMIAKKLQKLSKWWWRQNFHKKRLDHQNNSYTLSNVKLNLKETGLNQSCLNRRCLFLKS